MLPIETRGSRQGIVQINVGTTVARPPQVGYALVNHQHTACSYRNLAFILVLVSCYYNQPYCKSIMGLRVPPSQKGNTEYNIRHVRKDRPKQAKCIITVERDSCVYIVQDGVIYAFCR